jgi:DNA-binding NarL/FixJ family response regulator
MTKTKILLVDDHTIVRNGIRSIIEDDPDMEVIAEAGNGKEALEKLKTFTPDVMLVDITMPEMNGIELTSAVRKQSKNIKSLILSMHSNEEYILKSLEVGALGYILKDTSREEMLKAIRTVAAGERYFTLPVTNLIVDGYLKRVKISEKPAKKVKNLLSKREKEIVNFLVEGLSSREIADKLELSTRTVDNHRANIMKRLQVRNTAELVKIAMEEEL